MSISFITVDELAVVVRDPNQQPGTDYVVVDVRDEDFRGGHIPGALNIPAHHLKTDSRQLQSLVDRCKNVPLVVFHCALSQVRGPRSARIYRQAVGDQSQKVVILSGGFTAWLYKFRALEDPKAMIEDYNEAFWNK